MIQHQGHQNRHVEGDDRKDTELEVSLLVLMVEHKHTQDDSQCSSKEADREDPPLGDSGDRQSCHPFVNVHHYQARYIDHKKTC